LGRVLDIDFLGVFFFLRFIPFFFLENSFWFLILFMSRFSSKDTIPIFLFLVVLKIQLFFVCFVYLAGGQPIVFCLLLYFCWNANIIIIPPCQYYHDNTYIYDPVFISTRGGEFILGQRIASNECTARPDTSYPPYLFVYVDSWDQMDVHGRISKYRPGMG